MEEDIKEVIIEALNDYKLWFIDQGGDEEDSLDLDKVSLINKALKYIKFL
jgi:hypothetical protein